MQKALASLILVSATSVGSAATLWSNGTIVTNPTGGTGPIAGLPISTAENYPLPGSSLNAATTGVAAGTTTISGQSVQLKAADDFYVPDGNWDIDAITVYGFQTYSSSATTYAQTVTQVMLNLWDQTPYTAASPDLPPGTPIPQPLLSVPLSFDVTGQGTLVGHRVSGISTNTVRPVYSWTVPADALPNGGKLAPGHYWLEMSFIGDGPQTDNVFVPLVTPRAQNADHNARLFNVPFSGAPLSWFEGREGFSASLNVPGRAYSLPFELVGTPEPASLSLLAGAGVLLRRRRSN